jgi:hypothetical protein
MDPVCFTELNSGYPAGYCSEGCNLTVPDCAGDAFCADAGGTGVCVDGCTTRADCRDGYVCTAVGSVMGCMPSCSADTQCITTHKCDLDPVSQSFHTCITPGVCGNGTVEAGEQCDPPAAGVCTATCHFPPESVCDNNLDDDQDRLYDCEDPDCQQSPLCMGGTTPVGGACSASTTCLSNHNDPYCFRESGGSPGGYCSEACNLTVDDCAAGSFCADFGGVGDCLKSCTVSTDCRAGYTCQMAGTTGRMACLASCTDNAQCTTTLYCDLATGQCAAAPSCGNGVVEQGEACDPPDGINCNATCQLITAVCGNSMVQAGEQCDPPQANVCDAACQWIVPAGWTCTAAYYGSNDGCDCGCGVKDPDCADLLVGTCTYCNSTGSCNGLAACPGVINPTNNVACTPVTCGDGMVQGTETCDPPQAGTCDATCHRIAPTAWTCNAAYYGTGDGCDCGCGVVDPDCTDALVGSCRYCANTGTCNTETTCPGNINPTSNGLCVVPMCGDSVVQTGEQCDPPQAGVCSATCQYIVPAAWTCSAAYFGTQDGCDCGCGAHDPDCADALVASCGFCGNAGSCNGTTACPGIITPTNNATCVTPVCGNSVVEGTETCDPPLANVCDAQCHYIIPAAWTCPAAFFGDGFCDCGCAVKDPDCATLASTDCQYCGTGSCSAPGCATINATNNVVCQ